ncbi:methionine ABC transporter permease [Corynebacterium hadale]|uniref:Methionine ABC transporter permease n=1 Tax=Corynebacterium hadale TaxID=2026255 RepID=A0AB36RJT7_9CORY|nr:MULTISPECIES: methionine ABC transporter permease [Corynebacterium]PAT09777.1 methionine ABC transporter permease [Corynebacterium hadale]PAT14251.1 methionine ABC transporter permease [Corynebacterium sp. NML 120412]
MDQLNSWWRDTTGSRVTPSMYIDSFGETVYMVGISLFVGALIGIPLALALVITRPGGLKPNPIAYGVLNVLVNVVRSLPFIILLVAISPFTRVIAGTAIGTTAALVPLTLYIAPFIARLIEQSLLEVNPGITEAADSMGATMGQTIRHFLLPEAKSSITLAVTTATVGLISATAMAGTIGGGGVGDLAISYGYQQFDSVAMLTTVIILIVVVQAIQSIGNRLAHRARA